MTTRPVTNRIFPRTNLPSSGPGTATVLVGNTGFVDAVNGNNATAIFGRLDRPFLTVQAAVTAAMADASADVAVVIEPGDYGEDVVVPATAVSKRLGIVAWGGRGTVRLLSLEIKPPSVASPTFLEMSVDDLLLGELTAPVPTKDCLSVTENAVGPNGDIFLTVTDVDIRPSAAGIDGWSVSFPGAPFSFIFMKPINSVIDNFAAFTPTRAYVADFGFLASEVTEFRGYGATGVDLSGSANMTGFCPQITSFIGGFDAMTTAITPGLGSLFFINPFFAVDVGSAAHAITDSTGISIDLLGNPFFSRMGGTGGFSLAAGTLFSYADLTDDAGVFPPILGGPTEVFLALARSEGFDPSTTVSLSPHQQALGEELIRGRKEVRSPIAVAGPTAILATDHFLGADTAAVGAPMSFTLPAIATVGIGRTYTVKDITGSGAAFNITVTPAGAETIDGGASSVIGTNFGSETYIAESATNWSVY